MRLTTKNGTSYYDSELDAYFLTKDHSYFINLFGWSSAKYSRIQKSLVDNSLIMVDRVGKTQRNRIYPIDVLSFTDIKNNKEKTENEVIYQINDSDLSKSAYQNSVESTDLSKSDEGFIKIRQVIYQNSPSDLSKSDTNRLIFSNLNFSNLNISNHIEILKNDSIGYIQHFINSRNDFKRMDTKTKIFQKINLFQTHKKPYKTNL